MVRSILLLICALLVGCSSALDDKPTSWKESMRKRDAELKGEFVVIDNKFKSMEDFQKKLQAIGSKKEARGTYMNTNIEESLSSEGGSTFIRWGRKTCPGRSIIVYTGIASGKKHLNRGGGTNHLCLTKFPVFDNVQSKSYYSEIYGQRYLHIGEITNSDIPCTMCHTTQATTVMIPGTRTCPSGWVLQYSGHLVSSDDATYASEYTCLDVSPERFSNRNLAGSHGGLFIYVKADCNTLPCSSYRDSQVVTCAVCSK